MASFDGFQLASGHRRWLAARKAELKEVPFNSRSPGRFLARRLIHWTACAGRRNLEPGPPNSGHDPGRCDQTGVSAPYNLL